MITDLSEFMVMRQVTDWLVMVAVQAPLTGIESPEINGDVVSVSCTVTPSQKVPVVT